LTKAATKLRKEVKQMLYVVLAALFCFVGPTYFVLVMKELIPQIYAMIFGFVSFLIGIGFILKLVEE
jgi:CHASE2 domain-containing sensor protein